VKKLFAIAFTCVYLTLTVGVVQTTHYCMGRVKSQVLFSYESIKCPCSVLAKYSKQGCCNDEHDLLKIDDDQSASTVVSLVPAFFEIGAVFTDFIVFEVDQDNHILSDESPPPLADIPLFTKHCSLVFYDDEMIA
jgi:hypothetical protein